MTNEILYEQIFGLVYVRTSRAIDKLNSIDYLSKSNAHEYSNEIHDVLRFGNELIEEANELSVELPDKMVAFILFCKTLLD